MNEIRKQIIKLLEPYMEKTLCEGCIIIIPGHGYYKRIMLDGHYINLDNGLSLIDTQRLPSSDWTILGHYDISALLRFFSKKGMKVFLFDVESNNSYWIMGIHFKIPNKPLHLYTEEEDEKLLEILHNIKNEN